VLKKCGRCKIEKPLSEFHRHASMPDGRQGYCKKCNAEYMREYWHTPAGWDSAHRVKSRPEQRKKQLVRMALNKAVGEGLLPHISTQYCVDCGAPAQNYHHDDYSRPLDVVPLCRKCDYKRHNSGQSGALVPA